MSANFFNSTSLILGIGITVCSGFGFSLKSAGQILPPLRNPATENRIQNESVRIAKDAGLERQWQPFRTNSGLSRLGGQLRSKNDIEDQYAGEKKEWEPVLKLGQTGNMRSARRFEMETRPHSLSKPFNNPFSKRPQVFFDPDQEQPAGEESGGVLNRMSQRSQQAWSSTTSWFGERNQNLRERANQSWFNSDRANQSWFNSDRTEQGSRGLQPKDRGLFPRPFTDRQQSHPDLFGTDRF